MAEEKIVTLNLRKELHKFPRVRKGRTAIRKLKNLVKAHAKTENVKIDKRVNEFIWRRGAKKPATRVRVKIVKQDDGSARVELME